MYRPWVDRYFGVEMEFNQVTTTGMALTERQVKDAVDRSARLPVSHQTGWRHSAGGSWDVKTDSSAGATDGQYGWEVASPKLKLTDDAECEELKNVCRAIAALSPRVNRKCGLHVTVDVSDLTTQQVRNLVVLWARYEPYVFELCPQTRRANTYCPPIRKARWADQTAARWTGIERRIASSDGAGLGNTNSESGFPRGALNMWNWPTQKRIEFRLQAGTVNYEKIRRWTQFLLSFVQRAKMGAPFPMIQSGGWSDKGFSTLYVFKMLGLAPTKFCPQVPPESAALMAWCEERRLKFKDDAVSAAATAHRGF